MSFKLGGAYRAKGRGQKKVTADGLHPPVGGLRHARRTAAPLVCGAEERSEEDSGCCWRRAAAHGAGVAGLDWAQADMEDARQNNPLGALRSVTDLGQGSILGLLFLLIL